jgi:hypothetical protein
MESDVEEPGDATALATAAVAMSKKKEEEDTTY